MGSGASTTLSSEELEANLSEKDRRSLEEIRKAWADKEQVLTPQKRSEILEYLEELLVAAVVETCPQKLTVQVLHAFGLRKADQIGLSDVYVKISMGEKVFKTSVVNNTRSPSWDETFVSEAKVGDRIVFKVFDKDLFSKDDDLGKVEVVVERRGRGRQSTDLFQVLLGGGQGSIVFNYSLDFPNLRLKTSESFDELLENCDEALDMIAEASSEKASEIRHAICSKIEKVAAAIDDDRVVTRQEIRMLSPEIAHRYLRVIRHMMKSKKERKKFIAENQGGDESLPTLQEKPSAETPNIMLQQQQEEEAKLADEPEEAAETSEWFRLAGYHGWPDDFCAHRQENFPAWHRAYLIEFEKELRRADRELGNDGHIALPYWDYTQYTVNGQVIPSIYRELKGLPEGFLTEKNMNRKIGKLGFTLNSDGEVLAKLEGNEMHDNSYATLEENNHWKHASCENLTGMPIEAPHNTAHMAAGFPLTSLAYAAFHPLFYNIHCNVDRFYEKYITLEQKSMEEFKSHQKMRVQSDPKATNKFLEPLKPFTSPLTGETFTVEELMTNSTRDFGFVYDVLPKTRPPQMRELPTLAVFENVDVAMGLRDQENFMKSFELHVFVVPELEEGTSWSPPLDIKPHSLLKDWSDQDSGAVYGGWAGAFGGKGLACANCREARYINIFVNVTRALARLQKNRNEIVLRVLCIDEEGVPCLLKDLVSRYGPNCTIPAPGLKGGYFASNEASLSKDGEKDLAEAGQLQKYLKKYGFYQGTVDGGFGPVTEAAVKEFQKYLGLFEDGIAGPITKRAMLMPRNDHHPDISEITQEEPKFSNGALVKWRLGPHAGYLDREDVLAEVRIAFDAWQEHLPITMEEVDPDLEEHEVDLLISWTDRAKENEFKFDGRGGIVAHSTENAIEFDINERWGLTTKPEASPKAEFNVLPVLIHELGHFWGLRHHSSDPAQVMGAYYISNRIKLSVEDIQRTKQMYA